MLEVKFEDSRSFFMLYFMMLFGFQAVNLYKISRKKAVKTDFL